MIRYFDMFAGIGGFRAGLTRAGGFQCVGHCEIDKAADISYRAIHKIQDDEVYYEDARTIIPSIMPEFELLCAGFPCQAFSNAGKRQGFDDPRGTLFFEIARVVKERRPAYLLLENVPGLLSHDQGRTFGAILTTLCRLGYHVEWQVLNSKNFGVPQSRRRVFIVGYIDERCAGKILPIRKTNAKTLVQVISGSQGARVYDTEGLSCTLTSQAGGMGGRTGLYAVGFNRKEGIAGKIDTAYALNASNFRGLNRNQTQNAVIKIGNVNPSGRGQGGNVFSAYGLCPTLTTNKGEGIKITLHDNLVKTYAHAVLTPEREAVRQQGRRIKEPEDPMFTLTAQDKHGVLLIKEATKCGYKEAAPGDAISLGYAGTLRRGRVGKNTAHTLDTGSNQGIMTIYGRIRRLTPRECFRLQGFHDDQIDRILEVTSDSQAYKQAGNSVTVNVIHALGLRIRAMHEKLTGGDSK